MNIVQEFNVELFDGDDLWMPTMACEDDACYDVRARAFADRKTKLICPLGEMVSSLGDIPYPVYDTRKVPLVPRTLKIKPGGRGLILTGVFIELRPGWEVQVRPRSGLAWKNAITVRNSPGTVDAKYRDEVGIILANDDWEDEQTFEIKHGDRIGQLAFREVPPVRLKKVDKISRKMDRGGGFGHTGK